MIAVNDTMNVTSRTGEAASTNPAEGGQLRPRLSQCGFNRLGLLLVALNGGVFLADLVLYHSRLSIDWSTTLASAGGMLIFVAVWLRLYIVPGGREKQLGAELVFLVGLMVLLTNLAAVMQYGAIAFGASYVDPRLAAADAALGIHVPSLAAWTTAHRTVDVLLTASYGSLLVQFLLVIGLLAAYRNRANLWELAFHVHVCLIVTVACLLIFPAICPPAYYGFRPTIKMTRLIQQIRGFHAGTMTVVRLDQIEGLVSFPSFHVAAALIATWAVRHRRRVLIPIALLNVALIASTVLSGVHYAVDAIAAVPLFAGSAFAYRRWAFRLLPTYAVNETQTLETVFKRR